MILMSTDESQAASTPGNGSNRAYKFTKWVSPKHWMNLLDSFESSPRVRNIALVDLGAEVGFVTSTLGFLSGIIGGLGVFIFLAVLVALNACVAGYLIYKVMHIDDDPKSGENASDSAVTGVSTEN
jgi:hypothetical protein